MTTTSPRRTNPRKRQLGSTSPRGRRTSLRKWEMAALWRTGRDALYKKMVGSNDLQHLMKRSLFWRVVMLLAE